MPVPLKTQTTASKNKGGSTSGSSPFCLSALLNRDLLDVPFRAGTAIQHIVRLGVELVDDAAGLAHAHAGLRPAQQLSVVIELIDFARPVSAVNVLRRD